jgi:hypothetical protein
MSIELCLEKLKEQFKNLKPADIEAVLSELENKRSRVFNRNEDPTSLGFYQKVVELIHERRFQASAARREAAENAFKNQKNLQYATQDAFKGEPKEALLGLTVGGTTRLSKGGNLSISRIASDRKLSWRSQLYAGLKAAKVDDVLENGSLDREIAQGIWLLRQGGNPAEIHSNEVRAAAQVIRTINEAVLRAKQSAGSSIRGLEDYITRQSHDPVKIKEAGFDKWALSLVKGLDMQRTFGDLEAGKVRVALQEIYDQIISGRYDSNTVEGVSDQFITVRGASPNVSKQTSRARSLHFKDGYSWSDYNSEFGKQGLLGSVVSDIDRSARQVALMQKLGTNPDGAFQALKTRLKEGYAKEGNQKAVEELDSWSKRLDGAYATAKGLADIPGTSIEAKAAQTVRSMQALARLGNSYFSSIPDLAVAAATLRASNGKTVTENLARISADYVSMFSRLKNSKKWLERLDMFIDDTLGATASRMGGEDLAPGALTKLMRLHGKVTLMENHVLSIKAAVARQLSMDLADNAGKPFAELAPNLRANLERYGINEDQWKTMARAVTEIDGHTHVTPEAVRAIPTDFFSGGKKQRFDTETKLLAYLNDQADIASTTPGARQKFIITGGQEDEGMGIIRRLAFLFKSVPLLALNTSKRILLSNPETMPRGLSDLVKGKGDNAAFVEYLVWATVLGYIGNTARDAWQGKSPRDPKDPATLFSALGRSGVAGLYGDFITNEHTLTDAGSAAKSFLGPVISQILEGGAIAGKALTGKPAKAAAAKFAIENTPFSNLFWSRAAIDRAFLYQLQESLSPGFLSRKEENAQKQGQGFFFNRPTEAGK